MRILVAPDSFKGSLSAFAVGQALVSGLKKSLPSAEFQVLPLADGGEGTVSALVEATGGKLMTVDATGPLGEKIPATFGLLGDGQTAVIEMAAASGLPLLAPEQRRPLHTSTSGTGDLIRAALDLGVGRLVIGIGGSATNDGGAGMAVALGAKLLDENGQPLLPGGGPLGRLHKIDVSKLDKRLSEVEVIVACDVDNPLCGDRGASAVYGPQKGATPEQVAILDRALCHYASVIARDIGVDVIDVPGAGAAGGLGAGLLAFCGAILRSGIDIVIDVVGLEDQVASADVVITGEGRIDRQPIFGKTLYGVAKLAKTHNKPVIAVGGQLGEGSEALYEHGVDALVSIVPGPMALENAIDDAETLLIQTGERIGRLLRIGWKIGPVGGQ